MPYKPTPIDTASVTLADELVELGELLAKNAHDGWARQRMAEGWHLGPERNDSRREHPCLVPYEQLPETEKAYDRNVVLETLKSLVAMGYRLERSASSTDPTARAASLPCPGVDEDADPGGMNASHLLALWRRGDPESTPWTADAYAGIGQRALRLGEPLLACDVLSAGVKAWPDDVRLRRLHALALARAGAGERAQSILDRLDRDSVRDEETLGLLARTRKDRGLELVDAAARRRELRRAREAYLRAYDLHRGFWTGINAASLTFLLGEPEVAAGLARDIREQCLRELERPADVDRYWALATLGEACLLIGEWSAAEDWYGRAGEVGRGRWGDLSSTRRNARLLLPQLAVDPERIERCFRIPRVIVFTGHMIDAPGRQSPRFPAEREGAVRAAIRERVQHLDGGIGFSAAACGSDLLFVETLLERDGEVHVVLPYDRDRFATDSVEVVPGTTWGERYHRVLERAAEVVIASAAKLVDRHVSYEYGCLVLLGLATLRARQLDTEVVPLALWDGRAAGGPGGTASVVARWRRAGRAVEVLDLGRIVHDGRREPAPPRRTSPSDPSDAPPLRTMRIMAMLFADAVNFSRLSDDQMPRFVEHVLGGIGELLSRLAQPPVMRNTWGDGLCLVFASVQVAGEFALELADLVTASDWQTKGLPADLTLRIALHAGPVHACTDPVTRRPNFIGSHLSRGARIEPITPPGHVYASQGFAALAAAEGVDTFTCEYVGQTLWAKGYGTFPTYHLRRRAGGEPGTADG